MYLVYGFDRPAYRSAYWFYYLISMLVEFSVLVEISDHIFQRFLAIRKLGRVITVGISAAFAIAYVLPAVLWSHGRRAALLDLALRTFVTKLVVLAALFLVAHHYRSALGKNVGGLMLGFSLYLGVDITNLAADKAFDPAIYTNIFWIMTPVSYTLCLLVWTVSLWRYAPMPTGSTVAAGFNGAPEVVALELTRLNSDLSKFLDR